MCGGLLIRNPNKIRVLRAALFHILRGNAHSPRVHFGLRSVNSKRAIYKMGMSKISFANIYIPRLL